MGHAPRSTDGPRRARRAIAAVLGVALAPFACGTPERAPSRPHPVNGDAVLATATPRLPPESAPVPEHVPVPERVPAQSPCDEVPVYAEGRLTERVCVRDLEARGLTLLDLGDAWAPHVFDEDPSLGEAGVPPYRAVYLALADERWDALPEDVEPERYLELFGIAPTFRVLHARLADAERHACHQAIDDSALEAMTGTLRTWTLPPADQRARVRRVRYDAILFERERTSLGLARVEELSGRTARARTFEQFLRDRTRIHAIEALQDHLICDGLLDARRYERGIFDTRTAMALAVSQRLHVVVAAGTLDATTRERLALDSRESDFLAVLRALRERVVDATGLLEDGSARNEWGTVLGRVLDPPEMRTSVGHDPWPNGAPDLVSPATEAAARALGWTSPEGFESFFAGGAPPARVAVRLPDLPRYHARHMTLRAEVDRGDVWYDYPYTSEGRRRAQPVRVRPTLTLFAQDGDREVALMRWPTTIGGWKPERTRSGAIGLRYKESPVGPRLWRDVVAAPAWLPPPSTPDDELVRRVPGSRRYVANTALFGPSYRSAYGLAMVMHTRVIPAREEGAPPTFYDEGVRAHGSVSYASILRGTSHGCHRLYNHLAVRLMGFLLAHRDHVRHGSMQVLYARRARSPGGVVTFRIRSRGYRYELTPPVDVNVLRGNVLGTLQEAPEGMWALPRRAQADATATAAADENL
ncbi:MAG: hypothetical protein OHK0013_21860 [Sandaracinaceae bacterium]